MTESSPIPACLSHLTQRDAAVRARALEEAPPMTNAMCAPFQVIGPTPAYAPAPDEARGPHNACGAGSCNQPDRCASEGECHYTKSPFYQPSRVAPDEAASRVTRSAIDGASAPDRAHQVTAHETGGVADQVPGTDEDGSETWYREDYVKKIEAERDAMLSIRAELAAALRAMVYETTHLSRREDDGSHWCKISSDALHKARAVLAKVRP